VEGCRVFLIRHGQTAWNTQSRLQGHTDVPLDAVGREQALLVAQRFAGANVAAVYVSDLIRAIETARPIAHAVDAPLIERSDLREASFGDWEGLTREDLIQHHADSYEAYKQDPLNFTPPGGERISVMIDRVLGAYREISDAHDASDVLIVTSGGPLKGIALNLLEGTSATFHRLRTDNGAVSLVERGWLTYWNDTHHLGQDASQKRLDDALLRGRL
jgi:broad specificity phosphatase PhoE